ncbi:MAG: PA2779 family protein [Candidatus Didemnitutus sp.]|nr:PA2779 family protein [Candidatus Didemnitutus sp.]
MNNLSCPFRLLAWIRPLGVGLALAIGLFAVLPAVSASPISSSALLSESTRDADLASIQLSLEHKVVQQRLGELGFTPAEIQQRLANASDEELHQLAAQSDVIMAGGDGGIIVTILVIILLVYLIMAVRR